jgi:hypothetical protein
MQRDEPVEDDDAEFDEEDDDLEDDLEDEDDEITDEELAQIEAEVVAQVDAEDRRKGRRVPMWLLIPVAVVVLAMVVEGALLWVHYSDPASPKLGDSTAVSVPAPEFARAPAGDQVSSLDAARDAAIPRKFQQVVIDGLHRVAPKAKITVPDKDGMYMIFGGEGTGFRLEGTIELDGRRGTFAAVVMRSPRSPDCGQLPAKACWMKEGGDHSAIRIEDYAYTVADTDEAREVRTTVHRPGGSFVELTVDNAQSLRVDREPARTGRPAPLNRDQVERVATDPAVDLCLTVDCTSYILGS